MYTFGDLFNEFLCVFEVDGCCGVDGWGDWCEEALGSIGKSGNVSDEDGMGCSKFFVCAL